MTSLDGDTYGMKIRSEVLLQALQFENMVAKALAILLDIDENNNISFGNSTRALSFEAKVTLLMDLKVIEKRDKLIMSHFMAIRNKFMHRLDASSYERCVDQIQDLEKFIKNNYSWTNGATRESNLARGVWNIGNDCTNITTKLFYKILDKINAQSKKWSDENKLKIFEETIEELAKLSEIDAGKKEVLLQFLEILDKRTTEIRTTKL